MTSTVPNSPKDGALSLMIHHPFLLFSLFGGTVFVHGTSLFIGPMQWLHSLGMKHAWRAWIQYGFSAVLIAGILVFSFWLSLKMGMIVLGTSRKHVRLGIPLLIYAFVAVDILFWFLPRAIVIPRIHTDQRIILDFIRLCIPSFGTVVLLTPGLTLYAVFIGWVIGWMRTEKNVSIPFTRKIFHFLIFTMAAGLQPAFGLSSVILFGFVAGLTILYAVLRGAGFPFYEAIARTTDAPHSTFFVTVPFLSTAVGGVAANIISIHYAPIGYLITGWGDAVAEPVGLRWGRHRYKVPALDGIRVTRSLEGSLSILIVGGLVTYFWCLMTGMDPGSALKMAVVCASVGTAVEGVSNHGLDNFTIQAAVTAAAVWLA
jgi:phytol kinase